MLYYALHIDNLDFDTLLVHYCLQSIGIAIYKNRELCIGLIRGCIVRILVGVTAQHNIDISLVQEWKEALCCVERAVPHLVAIERWHMHKHDAVLCILALLALEHLLEPLCLLNTILIVVCSLVVLDIAIRLILATIENDEEYIALLEGVVWHTCRSWE